MRILLSFHYYRDTDLDALVAAFPSPPEVFADSGAFSAKSVGADVQLPEYVSWLHRWSHIFVTYANLDAIGDAEQTWVNQREMEAQGLRPLPVFHGGEPWEYLDRYLPEHAYVALGGMVATGGEKAVLRWCIECFQRARATGTVFHGFGQTTMSLLRALPWYSVDSSAWAAGHRYGTLNLWDDTRAGWVRCALGNRADLLRNAELIRAHGGIPQAMSTRGFSLLTEHKPHEQYRDERSMVVTVNAVAWLRMEQWLRRHHGPVVMPTGSPGPHVFLADSRTLTDKGADDLVTAARAEVELLTVVNSKVGPRVYLADVYPDHLVVAANGIQGLPG